MVEEDAGAMTAAATGNIIQSKVNLTSTRITKKDIGTNGFIIPTNNRATTLTKDQKMGVWTNLVY